MRLAATLVLATTVAACGTAPMDAIFVEKGAPASATAFAGAAVDNARLAGEVEWQFAGRTQRGWGLYWLLVSELVGTEATPASPEFASAVAAWERTQGIKPADGRITEDVWMRMTKALQSGRAFDSTAPPQTELLEVPASEWYDAARPAELRMLRRDAYAAYQRMVAAARSELGREAKGYFAIISGYRTREYQAGLREKAGNPSRAQLAVNSPHFTGRAIDLYVGGEPVSTADANRATQVSTPAYRWLVRNAKRFGFRPYFYEPWHWEYDPKLDRG